MAKKKAAARTVTVKKAPTGTVTAAKKTAGANFVGTKMTRTQVIRYMAERMGVPPKQITTFLDLLIETATTQTRKNGEFTIPGLGKLVILERAGWIGCNPATGEVLQVKAKSTLRFRLAKSAKDAVIPSQA